MTNTFSTLHSVYDVYTVHCTVYTVHDALQYFDVAGIHDGTYYTIMIINILYIVQLYMSYCTVYICAHCIS